MPTTFIAVQCFQCFSMQVKQQKKSGNTWTCVVCNEKQPLRKMFAQGFMAKDVRKFVQNFNMSRQLAERNQYAKLYVENYDEKENKQMVENQSLSNEGTKKRRTDWSEYVDCEEDGKLEKDEIMKGDEEPMIVTEMPKALFKKPKLENISTNRLGFEDGRKLLNPLFAKRQSTAYSQDSEPIELQETINRESTKLQQSDRVSKRTGFKFDIQEDSASKAAWLHQSKAASKGSVPKLSNYNIEQNDEKGPVSKWTSYLTEDDGDEMLIQGEKANLNQSSSQWKNKFETSLNGERVEEDIHPDFL